MEALSTQSLRSQRIERGEVAQFVPIVPVILKEIMGERSPRRRTRSILSKATIRQDQVEDLRFVLIGSRRTIGWSSIKRSGVSTVSSFKSNNIVPRWGERSIFHSHWYEMRNRRKIGARSTARDGK